MMKWLTNLLTSSIGRKITMALTGLFLISFLLVHAGVNALIFYNDAGATFNTGAHFMGTNPVIRTIEIVLVAAFLVHIIQGLLLWKKNRQARPVRYIRSVQPHEATWYGRSMALLGTILLLFLVVHTSNFWIPNRTNQFLHGEELPLYEMMAGKFQNPIEVILYIIGCVSLFWHLLHGFKSAFQSLGISNSKWMPVINFTANGFSFFIPLILMLMPIAFYFHWIT